MSLEAVLTENNNLLRELIALWKTGASPAPAPLAATVETKPETAKVEVVKEKKEVAAAPATAQPTAATDAGAQTSTDVVTYDQIKPLIIKINTTKGREAATALLAEFKVARGPDLKPDQFAKFFARATEVLA